MATIVLIGTLDTKGIEYEYMRRCLRAEGCEVILVDAGNAARCTRHPPGRRGESRRRKYRRPRDPG
jgi:uncharacterized protein (UPF0261 family)